MTLSARRFVTALVTFTGVALGAVGCAGDESTAAPASSLCDSFDTPYETYSAGMTRPGESERLQVAIVDATPAPPTRGTNDWTVQVLDMGGSPMSEATVVAVTPFMPDHGHGTSVVPEVGATNSDGEVDVSSIDFRMPGVWTVSFDVEAAGVTDRVVFGVCVDG